MKTGLAVLGVMLLALEPASAAVSYSGVVNGFFSDPVRSGNIVQTDGSNVFVDNTSTAVVTIQQSAPNNATIDWGDYVEANPPAQPFSILNFVGSTYTNVAPGQQFLLGKIEFTNGTSDINSLIFGATLHLDAGNGITVKTTNVDIVTTANTGLSAARDADFVGFSDFPQTFNVYEGASSVADLYGTIVGDPMLTLDTITIDPGSEDGGFIGTGVGGIPEPALWSVLIVGFFGMGLAARRRNLLATARI
jgi:hypothetical protein